MNTVIWALLVATPRPERTHAEQKPVMIDQEKPARIGTSHARAVELCRKDGSPEAARMLLGAHALTIDSLLALLRDDGTRADPSSARMGARQSPFWPSDC